MPVAPRMAQLQVAWTGFEERRPQAASILQSLAVAAQLAVLIVVVRKFRLESIGFESLLWVVFVGFLVHSQLPRTIRLPFFCGLSVVGFVVVLGVANTLWLLGAGGVLIALCHLPVRFGVRVLLLAGVGALLAVARAGWVATPMSDAVWPILGSIFMFRLMLYLYDLEHRKEPPSAAWTFAYFFMLPNVYFPLFPVVDYARFRTNYYSEPEHRIYQRGITWMFRGVCHLLIYRLVYHHVVLNPTEVTTTAQFVQYALGAFFLYLRVSGYFHLIVGMLLLFGFNLPETHHLYLLSSSFSDFWRRINIYWKDFMMKLFYYPVYFRLRRLGSTNALVLSTAVVFAMTWLLHSYQWFWLRGTVLLAAHDALFWSILGAAMIANAVYEQRFGRRRSLAGRTFSPPARFAVALRTAATFTVLCTLWSLWSSDSLAEWIDLWRVTQSAWLAGLLSAGVVVLVLAAAALDRLADRRPAARAVRPAAVPFFFWREAVPSGLAMLALAILGFPQVSIRLGETVAGLAESAQSQRLNTRDAAIQDRGYYEHLIAVNQQNAALSKLYSAQPQGWGPLTDTPAWHLRDDMLLGELVPGAAITWVDQPFNVNRWGLRDRDGYEKQKPPGTFRIVLLGSSYVYGRGVADTELFKYRLEDRLNAELGGEVRYEVMNFANPATYAINEALYLREKIAPFEPDMLIQFASTRDVAHAEMNLVEMIARVGVDKIPSPYLRDLTREALGAGRLPTPRLLRSRLAPHLGDMLSWGYRELVAECRRQGVVPVVVLLPLTPERTADVRAAERREGWIASARAAGPEWIDIADLYAGHELADLVVNQWDDHPNAFAHGLIADRIFAELAARRALLEPRVPDEPVVTPVGPG